jgi:hypothetical protein
MATAAFMVFSVSSLSLISIAGGAMGGTEDNNLRMKKSSIDGNPYLDYL